MGSLPPVKQQMANGVFHICWHCEVVGWHIGKGWCQAIWHLTANFQRKANNTASGEGNQAQGHLVCAWTQKYLYFLLTPWKYYEGSAVTNLLFFFFF